MNIRLYIYMHICVVREYIYIFLCIHICTNIHIFIYIHICTHIHIYTYILPDNTLWQYTGNFYKKSPTIMPHMPSFSTYPLASARDSRTAHYLGVSQATHYNGRVVLYHKHTVLCEGLPRGGLRWGLPNIAVSSTEAPMRNSVADMEVRSGGEWVSQSLGD